MKNSINHNDLLRFFGEQKRYQYISDGDKIKWVYLKENNPIGMEKYLKGLKTHKKLLNLLKNIKDYEKMYEKFYKKRK